MPEEQQQQLRTLTELRAERSLTPEEQETLEMLRQEYGRRTLYKARAYALLSLRG
jgi:predicted anti-sigma-YlaC factor YlaD